MNPGQRLEQAVKKFLQGVASPLSIPVYKGLGNSIDHDRDETNTQPQQRIVPCVTLIAEGEHTEAVFNSRLYQGILAVRVEENATRTDVDFHALCNEVFAKFNIVELAQHLSSRNSKFSCIQARIVGFGHAIKNGANWENTLRIDCCYGLADL